MPAICPIFVPLEKLMLSIKMIINTFTIIVFFHFVKPLLYVKLRMAMKIFIR